METGNLLTIWSARAAALLYALALALMFRQRWGLVRLVLTAGLAAYLFHVWCAFEYFYRWSHALALSETARQTALLFGVDWGGGLYLNYLFTGVWLAECATSWLMPEWWRSRPRWIAVSIHAFLVFMVINATIVVWIMQAWRK